MKKKLIIYLSIIVVVIAVLLILLLFGNIFNNSDMKKFCPENICFSEITDFNERPSFDNVFFIAEPSRYTVKSGDSVRLKVGFFNNQSESVRVGVTIDSCSSIFGAPRFLNDTRNDGKSTIEFMSEITNNKCGFNPQPIISSLQQVVSPGKDAGFIVFIHAKCTGEAQNKVRTYSEDELDLLNNLPSTLYGCKLRLSEVDEAGNIIDNNLSNISSELFELAVTTK